MPFKLEKYNAQKAAVFYIIDDELLDIVE